ncbi:MAG: hypothetical protein ACRDOE_11775, partial [Streptosporangiaceae bacterium]
LGAFAMVTPPTRISPVGKWPHHVALTLVSIRTLFGAITVQGAVLGLVGTVFGLICLLAAVFGFGRIVWTWRTAIRSEQLLCAGIVINTGLYVISTMPIPRSTYEIVAVLPIGAVLAARACVPADIVDAWRGRVAIATAALAALVPLTAAATLPPTGVDAGPVAAWLEAHGLTYGIAGYWDASAVTVQSENQVQVRAVMFAGHKFGPYDWETKTSWYDPSQHDATFVIGYPEGVGIGNITLAIAERSFGRPAAIYQVAGRVIMIYKTNLLKRLTLTQPLPTA